MKIYIIDKYLNDKEKLCEASKNNAYLLRKLWIDHFNNISTDSVAYPDVEEDGNLLIIIPNTRPIGQ